jgi:hypothetical protein
MRKIGISRSYLDGPVGEIRIYHRGGVSRIPLHGLRDGEKIAGMIVALFKQTRRGDAGVAPAAGPDITRCWRRSPAGPRCPGHSPSAGARHFQDSRKSRHGDCRCGSEAVGRLQQRRKWWPHIGRSAETALATAITLLKNRLASLWPVTNGRVGAGRDRRLDRPAHEPGVVGNRGINIALTALRRPPVSRTAE